MITPKIPPRVYIPELWIYDRAIIRDKVSKIEFVIQSLRFGESREKTTAELIPVSDPNSDMPHQGLKLKLSMVELEQQYESSGRRLSIISNSTTIQTIPVDKH